MRLAFASSGTGGSGHLAAELFMASTKVGMTHIPYKGNGPALVAQVGGEVQLGFNNILAVLPHVNNGRLKGIAVTSANTAGPRIPAYRSNTPKNAKNSDDFWRGIMLANNERLSAWVPPWTRPTSTASAKKWSDVFM